MRASDWVKASTSKGPWVPPPAKTSRGSDRLKMSWEVRIVVSMIVM